MLAKFREEREKQNIVPANSTPRLLTLGGGDFKSLGFSELFIIMVVALILCAWHYARRWLFRRGERYCKSTWRLDPGSQAARAHIYPTVPVNCADIFTTVSHITAYESEHLLKCKPDGVLT
ncbi:hypothetical protein L208DRAFT_1407687 [Tricholoma matsutake]|nr:hypothetical protein L208DRAFT_1407687 [Tricholoma matsutake 945]